MCGRYQFSDENEVMTEILRHLDTSEVKTGEIYPTYKMPVLVLRNNKITPVISAWGFPKFQKSGVIINARAETALEKPMFRSSLLSRRCAIPSTGFYEWDENKNKYLFRLPDTEVLYIGGFFNIFNGESRYIILTTKANESISEIHSRMPVVLDGQKIHNLMGDTEFALSVLQEPSPKLNRQVIMYDNSVY